LCGFRYLCFAKELIAEAGIKFRRFEFVWPEIKSMAAQPGNYVALICFALMIWNATRRHPHFAIGMAFSFAGVYWLIQARNSFEEFARAFASTTFNRKAMATELLAIIFFIVIWGGFDGEAAIAAPETTQIELKSDAGTKNVKICNVFRELSSVLLAVCDKHVVAINFASVVSVRYDIDTSKKF
jgi:hypothetical protein